MDINKKIEEIRQKPEHVRMQYVLGCVLLSMLILLSFWLFSFKINVQNAFNNEEKCTGDSCDDSSNFGISDTLKPVDGIKDSLDAEKKDALESISDLSKSE